EFEALEENTGTAVYFARPYHSWERGTNENTNGLLRQYFPKKQSMAGVTQEDVDRAVLRLNTRPRKRLGYQSPHTVFHTRVAFRD
ncbi:MAG TPA: IS30 family transposase, partial [Candidatus Saccharimonadia bacterium]|nr:IS30 family transposase [Candidatus Saccharimonadia bacterium]